MSGGSPGDNNGHVRLRHLSLPGGALTPNDEPSTTPADVESCGGFSLSPTIPRPQAWTDILQDAAWITSAALVVYLGDQKSNLLILLWRDSRIRRMALDLGVLAVALNGVLVLYMTFFSKVWIELGEKQEEQMVRHPAVLLMLFLGIFSFCSLSCSLWPIWSFMSIPLLFTLFMASLVLSSYMFLRPIGNRRGGGLVLRHASGSLPAEL